MSDPTQASKKDSTKPSLLSLNISSKSALYQAYMPFLRNGGVFIPTAREYALGDEVFILLTLMNEPSRLPIAGNVAWVTPASSQGGKAQGIGVQFGSDETGQAARVKIETILSGHLTSARATYTI
jgi:type IV pilus assembly protein PilZ